MLESLLSVSLIVSTPNYMLSRAPLSETLMRPRRTLFLGSLPVVIPNIGEVICLFTKALRLRQEANNDTYADLIASTFSSATATWTNSLLILRLRFHALL